MTLESKIKNFSRRDALKLGAMAGIGALATACGGGGPGGPSPIPPVNNEGKITLKGIDGSSGAEIYSVELTSQNGFIDINPNILSSKGANLSNYSQNLVSIREQPSDRIGTRIAAGSYGSIRLGSEHFNKTLVAYHPNTTTGATSEDYDKAQAHPGFVSNGFNSRYATVRRLRADEPSPDSRLVLLDGKDSNLSEACSKLTLSYRLGSVQLASILWDRDNQNANLIAGYGNAPSIPGSGYHSSNWFVVNPLGAITDQGQMRTAIMEALECHKRYDDIFGQDSGQSLLNATAGDISARGDALIKFAAYMSQ